MLGFFKYFDFFVERRVDCSSAARARRCRGRCSQIVLPVGISFYTFQTLSYTIDVYRGRLEPSASLLDFALFVAFFPQLVAGPIERARATCCRSSGAAAPLPAAALRRGAAT